ncbi:putative odorant receptor 85d isoform X2 [Leptopilina heterotoma]|uniref:putative odorant receptor 85d isoform X2 n=1 Tax=Leptopilina heterotoma TaxID=63436 RepID=UPI001CA8C0DE|nr:putative odorant receptor 85d isoform X2 [Leptopilina heterotoma]
MSTNPKVFNFILSLNESRSNKLPFRVYYFNYSEKYFYWIIIHLSFNTFLETVIFIVFESVLAVSIEHACGLFKKIGLHIEKINGNDNEKYNKIALIHCVLEHNRAIEFCDSIKSLYWPCFMFIVTLNKIFISFFFIQIVAHSNNFIVAVKYGAFIGNSIVHLFFNTFFAQRIIDYSAGLTDIVYNSLWYKKPSRIRKSLLLIMIRSKIPCNIAAVKLLNVSLRSACWVSIWYFTFMISTKT